MTDRIPADEQLPYECDICETRYRHAASAAWCCDPIANDVDEDHPTRAGIHRGID